jgi:hypothetical protein
MEGRMDGLLKIKLAESIKIKQHTEQFLNSGGVIQHPPVRTVEDIKKEVISKYFIEPDYKEAKEW